MASRIGAVTVDCRDARALATWWMEVLGYVESDDPDQDDETECGIVPPGGGQELLFIEVPEPKTVKDRLHLDLVPTDRRRDAEVERVVGLGATVLADLRNDDGTGWVVLADPEGNEFCILRSDEER